MTKLKVVISNPVILPMKKVKDKRISLSMNWYSNEHYMVKNKVKKEVKELVKKYLEDTGQDHIRFKEPVKVTFQYFKKTAIRTDTSNFFAVGAKFVYDALSELGYIEDDSSDFIVYEQQLKTVKDKDNPRMEFLFETA